MEEEKEEESRAQKTLKESIFARIIFCLIWAKKKEGGRGRVCVSMG
jgi:hypothetical protein